MSRTERSGSKRVHRVNVNFSEGAWTALSELAERTGRTVSQVLRDAIALERFFADVIDSGGRVLKEKNGRVQEVIFR